MERSTLLFNDKRLSAGAVFFSVIFIIFSVGVVPSINIPADFLKNIGLAVLGLMTLIICGLLGIRGGFFIPRSKVFVIPLIIIGLGLLSALVNDHLLISWGGVGYEADTVAFFLSFFVLFLAGAIFFGSEKGFQTLFGLLFSLFILVTLAEIIDLFFFQFMVERAATVVGSWFNLGIFYGFYVLFFALFLEFYRPRGIRLAAASVFLLFSVVMLVLVGFPLLWKIIGVYALLLCVFRIYLSFSSRFAENKNDSFNTDKPHPTPFYLLLLLVVALVFSVYSPTFSGVSNVRGITEIKPSPVASFVVLRGLYQENFRNVLLGGGPNRFIENWILYKPREVNLTPFWNTDFGLASSLFMTIILTTGLVGAFFWLLLIGYIHADFIRAAMGQTKDPSRAAPIIMLGALASFGWATFLFYNPGPVPLAMTALASGAGIGLSTTESFFVGISSALRRAITFLALVFVITIVVFGFMGITKRLLAIIHYQKGIHAFQENKTIIAGEEVEKATLLYNNDLFERSLSEIYQLKLRDFLNNSSSSELTKERFDSLASSTKGHAQAATKLNPNNYPNFISLGNVYTQLGLIGAPDTEADAKEAYSKSIKLNPSSPIPHFLYGRYLAIINKREDALKELELALTLKPDYQEAKNLLKELKDCLRGGDC